LLRPPFSVYEKCNFAVLREYFDTTEKLISEGKILSAWAAGCGGTAEAVIKMCMGNKTGFTAENELFTGYGFCGFVVETDLPLQIKEAILIGRTTDDYILKTKTYNIPLGTLQNEWEKTLEPVYPYLAKQDGKLENFFWKQDKLPEKTEKNRKKSVSFSFSKPRFIIPVFPGTNSEYDSGRGANICYTKLNFRRYCAKR